MLKRAHQIPIASKIIEHYLPRKIPLIQWDFDKINWCLIDSLQEDISEYKKPNIDSHDIAFLQYTSGSTGDPKGVMVSHQNILSNLQVIYEHFVNKPGEISVNENKALMWLPPYHDMGLIAGVLGPIYSGFPSILMSPFTFLKDPYFWLKSIEKYQATISGGPDFAYEYCCKKITQEQKVDLDLGSWEIAFNGSEPIKVDTLRKFYHTFKDNGLKESALHPCYGLAEGTLFVSGMKVADNFKCVAISNSELRENRFKVITNDKVADKKIIVSSGWVNDKVHIKIVNPETMKLSVDNEIGEIWISGSCTTKGYWNKEVLSKEVFCATIVNGDQQNKYLRTGDLGFIHELQLYVTGRIKDIIIKRGQNYYPQDIEKAAEEAYPLLRKGRSAAFSIENDESVIVIEFDDFQSDEKHDFNHVASLIRNQVADQCALQIDHVLFLKKGTLTKTTSGKIQRQDTKLKYLNNKLNIIYASANVLQSDEPKQSSSIEKLTKSDIEVELTTYIAKTSHIEPDKIDMRKSLNYLALDSMQIMELILFVENKFNYKFDSVEEIKDLTLSKIAHNISEHTKGNRQATVTDMHHYTNAQLQMFANMSQHPKLLELKNSFEKIQRNKINTHFFEIHEEVGPAQIVVNNKELVNYSSSNYLGLSQDSRIREAIIKAVERYGSSVSASRLVAGEKQLHQSLEQSIVDLTQTEAAVVFNSGHSANITTISYLYDKQDLIVLDELCHNSLFLGAKYSGAKIHYFKHNDVQSLEEILAKNRDQYKHALIIIEGVYGMDGDIPNMLEFIKLKKKYYTHLMLDEAHSIGTIGKTGRGISEYYHFDINEIDILMGTLSKSFVSCGAFIAGRAELIQALKYGCPGFVYTVGITPANAAAAYAAIEIMKQEPYHVRKLQDNATLLLSLLTKNEVNTGLSKNSPVIPILVGDTMKAFQLAEHLREHQIYAFPIISPAVPTGTERVRLFLSAAHTDEQLKHTADVLIKAKDKFSLQKQILDQ